MTKTTYTGFNEDAATEAGRLATRQADRRRAAAIEAGQDEATAELIYNMAFSSSYARHYLRLTRRVNPRVTRRA